MNNISIVLPHKHYDDRHLEMVTAKMRRLGAPIIRCIWNEQQGVWMAIEGSHRLRAAHNLGLTPIIKDVSRQDRVRVQIDGESVRLSVRKLADELANGIWMATVLEWHEG